MNNLIVFTVHTNDNYVFNYVLFLTESVSNNGVSVIMNKYNYHLCLLENTHTRGRKVLTTLYSRK